jgi:glycosyltransferase involved in cell wall biosynthesis
MRRRRILALFPSVPIPANTGGALRALTMMRALDRAFELTVLAWGADDDALGRELGGRGFAVHKRGLVDQAFTEATGLLLGNPLGYSRYGWFPQKLTRLLEKQEFDAIHFDHPHTALLLPTIRKLQPQAKLVLDAHNVEAEIIERLAVTAPIWRRKVLRWQAVRIRELETELARNMDMVFACSDKDARAFSAMGADEVRVVPNSIPPLAPSLLAERKDVVFVGSLDWQPNAEAVVELARDIWPRCRALLPGARLVIVGRNPPTHVQELASRDVLVMGSVPSVQPYLDAAFATAIPLRAGSGTRIKILEAWAAGVPVVASEIAAEGLPYENGRDIVLAERPAEFARALVRLWRDRGLSEELVAEGRRTVQPFTAEHIALTVAKHYREMFGDEDAAGSYEEAAS